MSPPLLRCNIIQYDIIHRPISRSSESHWQVTVTVYEAFPLVPDCTSPSVSDDTTAILIPDSSSNSESRRYTNTMSCYPPGPGHYYLLAGAPYRTLITSSHTIPLTLNTIHKNTGTSCYGKPTPPHPSTSIANYDSVYH